MTGVIHYSSLGGPRVLVQSENSKQKKGGGGGGGG